MLSTLHCRAWKPWGDQWWWPSSSSMFLLFALPTEPTLLGMVAFLQRTFLRTLGWGPKCCGALMSAPPCPSWSPRLDRHIDRQASREGANGSDKQSYRDSGPPRPAHRGGGTGNSTSTKKERGKRQQTTTSVCRHNSSYCHHQSSQRKSVCVCVCGWVCVETCVSLDPMLSPLLFVV